MAKIAGLFFVIAAVSAFCGFGIFEPLKFEVARLICWASLAFAILTIAASLMGQNRTQAETVGPPQ